MAINVNRKNINYDKILLDLVDTIKKLELQKTFSYEELTKLTEMEMAIRFPNVKSNRYINSSDYSDKEDEIEEVYKIGGTD